MCKGWFYLEFEFKQGRFQGRIGGLDTGWSQGISVVFPQSFERWGETRWRARFVCSVCSGSRSGV